MSMRRDSPLPYDQDAYTIVAGRVVWRRLLAECREQAEALGLEVVRVTIRRRLLSVKIGITVRGADPGLMAFKQYVTDLTAEWRVDPVLP
jgi:hypothetical protein